MKKTIGGDTLGRGKKMQVQLHAYERSTHDRSYLWRSSMSAGTLVPFMVQVGLPGDTFDIDLTAAILTHPTLGPLFGSYKAQFDVFECPMRLYQGRLHNNPLDVGMDIAQIKFPLMKLRATPWDSNIDLDNAQINPSCIFSYLGIRGVGINRTADIVPRYFNAIPYLAYWDIYKNFYANKQEGEGVMIHTQRENTITTLTNVNVLGQGTLPEVPTTPVTFRITVGQSILFTYSGTHPIPSQIMLVTDKGEFTLPEITTDAGEGTGNFDRVYNGNKGTLTLYNWRYKSDNEQITNEVSLLRFPLENIDNMRNLILGNAITNDVFIVNDAPVDPPNNAPYNPPMEFSGTDENLNPMISTQEGLAIKQYQSDLLNNWLNEEFIDGPGGISQITAIDTSGGSITQDTINFSRKLYQYLNRVAVSGGSLDDWYDATYTHNRYTKPEIPVYHGGLSKEVIFQEVVSNAASNVDQVQPLGTLAGRGTLGKKHKGGKVTIKCDEPCYIMGIVSLTPRIDNSQGNTWHTFSLMTMDDLHKPALDEIGFQDLPTEQMGWFSTKWDDTAGEWVGTSAGKQPAWIQYMTSINETRGNFAILNNEMFMTLNRRYTPADDIDNGISDITTYIDPSKFNFIFAQTSLDSQNFWTQIGVNIEWRGKISAKVMPL